MIYGSGTVLFTLLLSLWPRPSNCVRRNNAAPIGIPPWLSDSRASSIATAIFRRSWSLPVPIIRPRVRLRCARVRSSRFGSPERDIERLLHPQMAAFREATIELIVTELRPCPLGTVLTVGSLRSVKRFARGA